MAKRSVDDKEEDPTKKMRTTPPLRKVEFNPDRVYYQFVILDEDGFRLHLLLDPNSVSTQQLDAIIERFEEDALGMSYVFTSGRYIDVEYARESFPDAVGDWAFAPTNEDLRKNNQCVKVDASFFFYYY